MFFTGFLLLMTGLPQLELLGRELMVPDLVAAVRAIYDQHMSACAAVAQRKSHAAG